MVYHLTISTWVNWCPGALHYYGRVKADTGTRDKHGFTVYFEHDLERATSPQSVRRAAKRWFKGIAKPYDVLVESPIASYGPARVLAAVVKPGTLRAANAVWKVYDELIFTVAGYAGHRSECESLESGWRAIWFAAGVDDLQ